MPEVEETISVTSAVLPIVSVYFSCSLPTISSNLLLGVFSNTALMIATVSFTHFDKYFMAVLQRSAVVIGAGLSA